MRFTGSRRRRDGDFSQGHPCIATFLMFVLDYHYGRRLCRCGLGMETGFRQCGVFSLFVHVGVTVLLSATGVHVHHEFSLRAPSPVVVSHRDAACEGGELPVGHLFELLRETVLPETLRNVVEVCDLFPWRSSHEFPSIAVSLCMSISDGLLPSYGRSLRSAVRSAAKSLLASSRAPPVQAA